MHRCAEAKRVCCRLSSAAMAEAATFCLLHGVRASAHPPALTSGCLLRVLPLAEPPAPPSGHKVYASTHRVSTYQQACQSAQGVSCARHSMVRPRMVLEVVQGPRFPGWPVLQGQAPVRDIRIHFPLCLQPHRDGACSKDIEDKRPKHLHKVTESHIEHTPLAPLPGHIGAQQTHAKYR